MDNVELTITVRQRLQTKLLHPSAILHIFTTAQLLHELRDRAVIEGANIISIAPAYRDINALTGGPL